MYRRPVISIYAPWKAHHSPMVWCTPRRFEVISSGSIGLVIHPVTSRLRMLGGAIGSGASTRLASETCCCSLVGRTNRLVALSSKPVRHWRQGTLRARSISAPEVTAPIKAPVRAARLQARRLRRSLPSPDASIQNDRPQSALAQHSCVVLSGTGTCTSTTATDPTGLVSGSVLIFTLPQHVFSGTVSVTDPNGTTISDALRFFNSASPSESCPPIGLVACADKMIFYSFDSNGLDADVGPLTTTVSFTNNVQENPDGSFVFNTPNGANHYDGTSAAS
jgi:hypothetical protein